jgi:hypothetical protein
MVGESTETPKPEPSTIEPKPPPLLQHIAWLLKHGPRNKLIVALGAIIVAFSAYQAAGLLDWFRSKPSQVESTRVGPRAELTKRLQGLRVRFRDGSDGTVSMSYIVTLSSPSAQSRFANYDDQKKALAKLHYAVKRATQMRLEARTIAEARQESSAIERSIVEQTRAAQERTRHTIRQAKILAIEPRR